jgi:hypothetical protein
MVQTFYKVSSAGDIVPNATGITLGIAALPGGKRQPPPRV